MASRITLPFWPSSLDCLKWSSDNLIAVGGGDQIGILTPRLQGPGPNGTLWNSTYFKANAFTTAEAPLLQPLTSENFSVGEELSQRHVHALEWSPPGLARFGQGVLGVLSTNHVLSLWECEGRSDVGGNWRRKVVVNHALISHYSTMEKATGETDQLFEERKQVSQRIRAFAWGPQNRASSDEQGFLDEKGSSLLAVSTEAGEILVLRIRPPYNILETHQTDWQIEVLHIFEVKGQVKEVALQTWNDGGVVDDPFQINDRWVADHLAWSDWQSHPTTEASKHSSLAFIVNGKLYSSRLPIKLSSELDTSIWTDAQHLLPAQSRLTGPLKFIPKTDSLTVFGPDTANVINLSPLPGSDNNITMHHLDDRWDEISGVAFTLLDKDSAKMQIVSHMSTANAVTSALSLPLHSDEVSAAPKWQIAIKESKKSFGNQYDLEGHVQDRTWGIASSPFGEYVATAITLLPSDSISHTIPSDRHTVITISQEVPFTDEDIFQTNDDKKNVPSQVTLFHLQRYLGERPTMTELQSLVMGTIPGADAEPEAEVSENGFDIPDEGDASRKAAWLRKKTVNRGDMAWERKISLATMALQLGTDGPRRSPNIIRRVTTEVLRLDEYLERGGELSERIRNVYSSLAARLRASQQPSEERVDSALNSEICRICEEPIFFESIRWARCRSGHQFSRCGLTFLSIQEPGFSKHCGVCGLQVFNEWKLSGLTSAGTPNNVDISSEAYRNGENADVQLQQAEPTASLARTLFAALDSCVYCGGKFNA
jgi:hypothetical protein